ncbi:MAG: helix-turn-helix transcriptional regulator [Planctomycetes bacterium]|nr:helix-turn-helix transcriptional regulator [Planctomycetota bacterium]
MPVRRSSKVLPAKQVRRLKRDARRIDREQRGAIRRKGRAVKARHERLRDIVQVLRAERKRRGLSLAEIGERSGIGKANLSRLENALDPNPTMDTLLRYAEALGCAIHIALSEPDPPNRRRAAG